MERKIIAIAGPTGVGKTKYAIDIAKENNGEIVSCDSMQLYKYMNIGTAKPTPYELSQVKHHLIGEIDPKDTFTVYDYTKLAKAAIEEIFSKGKLPIIVGGTGLYLNALLYNMDFGGDVHNSSYRRELEELAVKKGNLFLHGLLREADAKAAATIHPNNIRRVIRALETIHTGTKYKSFSVINEKTTDYDYNLIGLMRDREDLYKRINLRVDEMINKGLIDEVKRLVDDGFTKQNISMKGIGYKELIDYLNDMLTLEDAIDLIKRNTRRYAKRQMTWFRRYEELEWVKLKN